MIHFRNTNRILGKISKRDRFELFTEKSFRAHFQHPWFSDKSICFQNVHIIRLPMFSMLISITVSTLRDLTRQLIYDSGLDLFQELFTCFSPVHFFQNTKIPFFSIENCAILKNDSVIGFDLYEDVEINQFFYIKYLFVTLKIYFYFKKRWIL